MIDHILDLEIGDYVKVECHNLAGEVTGWIKGTVTKLWKNQDTPGGRNLTQAQVNNGWCFHQTDSIIEHKRENHLSDCAVHNEPAYPAKACDCGVQ